MAHELQIHIVFDGMSKWEVLRFGQLMCDLEHAAIILTGYPFDKNSVRNFEVEFDPKYEQMIVGNFRGSTLRSSYTPVNILKIRKESPLEIVIGVLCSVGGAAGVASIIKLYIKIVLDLQKIKRAKISTEREMLRAIKDRLLLSKEYLKIRKSLKTEEEREILDANFANAVLPMVDGRYPQIEDMGTH